MAEDDALFQKGMPVRREVLSIVYSDFEDRIGAGLIPRPTGSTPNC
jgi:hypothetical protein